MPKTIGLQLKVPDGNLEAIRRAKGRFAIVLINDGSPGIKAANFGYRRIDRERAELRIQNMAQTQQWTMARLNQELSALGEASLDMEDGAESGAYEETYDIHRGQTMREAVVVGMPMNPNAPKAVKFGDRILVSIADVDMWNAAQKYVQSLFIGPDFIKQYNEKGQVMVHYVSIDGTHTVIARLGDPVYLVCGNEIEGKIVGRKGGAANA